jgi:hypothetical protein
MRNQLSLYPVAPPPPALPPRPCMNNNRKVYADPGYLYDQNIAKLTDFISELQTTLSSARYNNTELSNQCIKLQKIVDEKDKQENELVLSLRKDVETWKKLLEDKDLLYDRTKRHCYEVEEDKQNIVREHSALLKEFDQLKNKHQSLVDEHAKTLNLLTTKDELLKQNENKHPTRLVKKTNVRSPLTGKKRKHNYACSDNESIIL